ncbi:MAG: hypothetical protein J0H61_14295, partial [Alphaproteobacteria bacterium]|nr:hypothetical protein [Alphaproteobacteria bacterium]
MFIGHSGDAAQSSSQLRIALHVQQKMGRLVLEQTMKSGFNRRSFLRNAGVGSSVLALGPLAASLTTSTAASAAGAADFDTIANRLNHDSVKWDGMVRNEHVDHVVAGMG